MLIAKRLFVFNKNSFTILFELYTVSISDFTNIVKYRNKLRKAKTTASELKKELPLLKLGTQDQLKALK